MDQIEGQLWFRAVGRNPYCALRFRLIGAVTQGHAVRCAIAHFFD